MTDPRERGRNRKAVLELALKKLEKDLPEISHKVIKSFERIFCRSCGMKHSECTCQNPRFN